MFLLWFEYNLRNKKQNMIKTFPGTDKTFFLSGQLLRSGLLRTPRKIEFLKC